MPPDMDPVEQFVIPESQTLLTAVQLAAIQQTIQQSVAEVMYSHCSQVVPDTVQPCLSFLSASPAPGCSKPDHANPGLVKILISFL